ncbi:MAG: sigma-70 family RNA polymerase sigma factor [Phycisphaerales bacterium]|nr:sigma-70 family RNA polymerase sigma factor [Phycisphaerales bacterium]
MMISRSNQPKMSNNEVPSDEDALIRAAVAGDTAALAALLRTSGTRLREQLSIDRRWQSVLEADDVLQVTYLEAFLKVGSFVPGGSNAFYGWLRRIAENNLRDAIKGLEAQKRPPPALAMDVPVGDQSTVALFDLLGVTSATPSRAAAVTEMKSSLDRALESLPHDYAEVIRAYDLEGLPVADVAAQLGRSPGAVHMLRARAHEQLRALLGPSGNFFSTPA